MFRLKCKKPSSGEIRVTNKSYQVNNITPCWELIIKHVQNIHFGTRDSSTYVIFAIDQG